MGHLLQNTRMLAHNLVSQFPPSPSVAEVPLALILPVALPSQLVAHLKLPPFSSPRLLPEVLSLTAHLESRLPPVASSLRHLSEPDPPLLSASPRLPSL